MTHINTIKNERNNHDKSINEIAKTVDINWLTVKKYADSLVLLTANLIKKSGMMYDDYYAPLGSSIHPIESCNIQLGFTST